MYLLCTMFKENTHKHSYLEYHILYFICINEQRIRSDHVDNEKNKNKKTKPVISHDISCFNSSAESDFSPHSAVSICWDITSGLSWTMSEGSYRGEGSVGEYMSWFPQSRIKYKKKKKKSGVGHLNFLQLKTNIFILNEGETSPALYCNATPTV